MKMAFNFVKMICIKTILKYVLHNIRLCLTIVAVLLGLLLGFLLRKLNPSSDAILLVGFPGEIFMRLLKLIILPLIVSSIMSALTQVDPTSFRRMGILTIIYYGCTTTLAIITGILCVMLIRPGMSSSTHSAPISADNNSTSPLDTLLDIVRNMFPDNLIQATFEKAKTVYIKTNVTSPSNVTTVVIDKDIDYVSGINVLGLIVISMVVGIVLSKMSKKAKPLIELIFIIEDIIMNIVELIMWFSPIGIISMITSNVMQMDNPGETAGLMGKYLMTILLALFIHTIITMPALYILWCRKNPIKVIQSMVQSLVMTFGTSSSGAALPISIRCMEENHRVDQRVTRFILPLGCNINMDGNALYEAIAVIFIAQMNNIYVSWPRAIIISLITTLSSLGLNSLPAGLVSILVILDTLGFPTKDLPLIMTVDWLIDRIRTTINVLGDAYATDAIFTVVKNKLSNTESGTAAESDYDKSEDISLSSAIPSSQDILHSVKEV